MLSKKLINNSSLNFLLPRQTPNGYSDFSTNFGFPREDSGDVRTDSGRVFMLARDSSLLMTAAIGRAHNAGL